MKKEENIKRGKRSRAAGLRFEKKVREDYESKGYIVVKWNNNLKLTCKVCKSEMHVKPDKPFCKTCDSFTPFFIEKMKPASPGRFRMMQTGFPDFIVYRLKVFINDRLYKVIAIESKTNGYLDKIEKSKCQWYLDNKVFSKILIASKGKKRGEILYKEYGKEYMKGGKEKENGIIRSK